jgi:hypothetical protein
LVGILGGLFFQKIMAEFTVVLQYYYVRWSSVITNSPSDATRLDRSSPGAACAARQQSPAQTKPVMERGHPSDKGVIRCHEGLVPSCPPRPPSRLPSLRKSEWPWSRQGAYLPSPTFMTCISRLPCWALDARFLAAFLAGLAATLPTDPHSLTSSHVHWPSAPGSGPAAWSATESLSHGTLGFNLRVALVCPKSRPQPVSKHLRSELEGGEDGSISAVINCIHRI